MEWFGQYSPGPVPSEPGDIRPMHPGERLTENWDAYPLHPGANVLLDHEPNMFGAVLPSALRAGGKTWHRARVSGHGGSYTAVFTAPPSTSIWLRTTAADAAGGTVTETITSAYRTGR